MASPAQVFRAAREAALRASSALQTAMGGTLRLYTDVPTNAPLPYIVLGQDEVRTDKSGCADEVEITATLTWWSKTSPLDKGAQAAAMGSAIIDAIGADLAVAGWDVMFREDDISEQYAQQPDQSTRGVLTLTHELTEITA